MKINTKNDSWLLDIEMFKEEKHKSKQGSLGVRTKCKQDHNNTPTFTHIGHR